MDKQPWLTAGASFSPCRTWRYSLLRVWDYGRPAVNVIGLNPSTADEQRDDPTIRRCLGFARREGFGALYMTNLFALRATNPAELAKVPDPIGPTNNAELVHIAGQAQQVWVAWGVYGAYHDRGAQVRQLLEGIDLWCLGTTRGKQPRHPLYLAGATPLVRYDA